MAQLGYQRLKDTLTEGAAQAWKTNVESAHPVPAFAYGASALRFLTRAKPRHDVAGLHKTIALADPILAGLGFVAK